MAEKYTPVENPYGDLPPRIEDTLPNAYSELVRSTDYSDETKYTTAELEALGRMWLKEAKNETGLRSPRGLGDIERIIGRLVFEITWRNQDTDKCVQYFEMKLAESNVTPTDNIPAAEV